MFGLRRWFGPIGQVVWIQTPSQSSTIFRSMMLLGSYAALESFDLGNTLRWDREPSAVECTAAMGIRSLSLGTHGWLMQTAVLQGIQAACPNFLPRSNRDTALDSFNALTRRYTATALEIFLLPASWQERGQNLSCSPLQLQKFTTSIKC